MLCIVGFLQLEGGDIHVKDLKVGKKNLRQVRREVGMIFQNADDQLFMPTLYEDVAFGVLNRGMKQEDLDRTVRNALADRGLSGLEEKFPGHLSGGQKRLASLAGVLVMEPGILLHLMDQRLEHEYVLFANANGHFPILPVFADLSEPWMRMTWRNLHMEAARFDADGRIAAISVAVSALWIACFILTFLFPILTGKVGMAATFWLYAGICVLGFVFVFLRVPETKGKTLEQIERELVG